MNDPSASEFQSHKLQPHMNAPHDLPRSNKMLKTAYNRKSQ